VKEISVRPPVKIAVVIYCVPSDYEQKNWFNICVVTYNIVVLITADFRKDNYDLLIFFLLIFCKYTKRQIYKESNIYFPFCICV